jgi:hypothetical protein
MKIQALKPSRAACAATAFAKFPVDEHATVSRPKISCLRQRHRNHAILEAESWKANRIILDAEPPGANFLS